MEYKIVKHQYKIAIVGSGASGYATAQRLLNMGETEVVMVTEGINMGTSRNTGSDKQTYYKLGLAGDNADSVESMANTLFQGGATDGDTALVEAALSARGFFNLIELGVPFPSTKHGQYAGYKTDHDPSMRGSSIGPLTSKKMTENLQSSAQGLGLKYLNGVRVVRLLTSNKGIYGFIGIDRLKVKTNEVTLHIVLCENIVWATGGSAGIYGNTVYPNSQTGGLGAPILAGLKLKNLTEWQYGIASIKFKWNLSGTYQQVLPKYVSTDRDGNNPYEFLLDGFDSIGDMLTAVFLKGYQWPFDADRIDDKGSSIVDIMVHKEINEKGRRVFMDFNNNPYELSFEDVLKEVSSETKDYLEKSGANQPLPIDRLNHMNKRAIKLYANNGIDLYTQMLEISVCAQHQNGGLETDLWWRTTMDGLYCVGEAAGTHGIKRPGGSALNAGQVGAIRCAEHIHFKSKKVSDYEDIDNDITRFIDTSNDLIGAGKYKPKELLKKIQLDMDKCCAHIRDVKGIKDLIDNNYKLINNFNNSVLVSSTGDLYKAFITLDLLYTQTAMLVAVDNYYENGGHNRGSAMYQQKAKAVNADLSKMVQNIEFNDGKYNCNWRKVRPIPREDLWFENVWNAYNNGLIKD